MSYINIEQYTKKIKDNVILDNISIQLEKNRIYGFVGINGSGKTMLFRAIVGLISPTEGKIIVDNTEVGNGKHPKSVGLVLENANLWAELSAYDNLKILNKMSNNPISNEEIKSILVNFGLEPNSKKVFKAFSLGMKQKLRLAQAFMGNPELIVLDEPTNALDENSVKNIHQFIKHQKEKGATILLASHSKVDIECLCDEIIYMDSGKITKHEKVKK